MYINQVVARITDSGTETDRLVPKIKVKVVLVHAMNICQYQCKYNKDSTIQT